MEKSIVFSLDTPYRERLEIEAFNFGRADAPVSVGVMGSMRGNEVQQTYICAQLVNQLRAWEEAGRLNPEVRITVIPSGNSFSMNIASRFWPMDNTHINRMFPGYDQGETTQRIAAGLFDALKDCTFGLQLASYYLPGEFENHIRMMDVGTIDMDRAWKVAKSFGFPYAVLKTPAPFDTTTLNYNWQVWGTCAYSIYSAATDHIDDASAQGVLTCIERFLGSIGALDTTCADTPKTRYLQESSLMNVRTRAAGFFKRNVNVGDAVKRGDEIARVLSTEDCHVLETLVSPCTGTVFFRHGPAMINGETIAFKIAPDEA